MTDEELAGMRKAYEYLHTRGTRESAQAKRLHARGLNWWAGIQRFDADRLLWAANELRIEIERREKAARIEVVR